MIKITDKHIDKFKKIKKLFFTKSSIPKPNNWKEWTNNEIWLHFIIQVIVVGGSEPARKFNERADLKEKVSYVKLSGLKDEDKIKKNINYVLRTIGARYASKDINKCRKTKALTHNLKILSGFINGPKWLLKRVASFDGKNEDRRKIRYFMKIFRYIQSKSARDFLMELGLVKNAIALDVRIQNILKKVGVEIPKGLENNPRIYDEVEKELLEKVCNPLGLLGVQMDRMLYQNYDSIMKLVVI